MDTMDYHLIRERFLGVCESRGDIVSSVVFGSQARADGMSDEWSDLDLLTFCDDPNRFLVDMDWLREIGDILIWFFEPNVFGCGTEIRVLFAGGLDVDFLFFPASDATQIMSHGEVISWIKGGNEIIVDRNGRLEQLVRAVLFASQRPDTPPSLSEYQNLVGDFQFHTVWTIKKLLRGELLTAKSCCDSYMKELLLRMAMWGARSRTNGDPFPYYGSRYFERWAEPWLRRGLANAYAHYDADDLIRALDSTSRLFSRIARETGEALGYEYPARYEEHSRRIVTELMSSR